MTPRELRNIHSATRKHLFLYPQGDRSGLGKPKNISDFDDEERKLLMLHCGLENMSSICDYHERVYFGKFVTEHGNYCCDPFHKQNKRVKGMPYRKFYHEFFILNF